MNIEILHNRFETWFNRKYEWEITRKRRGYDLRRAFDDESKYMWEFPQQQWEAFKGAVEMVEHMLGEIG